MEVLVISPQENIPDEIDILIKLFKEGLELFHVYKPNFCEEELEKYILSIPEEYWDFIVLHNHYELAYKYELYGVHCRAENQDLNHAFKSSSCDNLKDLQQIKNLLSNFVLLGPIFEIGNSKILMDKHALMTTLQKPRQNGLFALGGVNENNIKTCAEMGFDGVAIKEAIWNSKHPISVFKNIRNQCQKLYKEN